MTIVPPWAVKSPMRAAGMPPISTVIEPMAITSGGPTHKAMSPTRAAGPAAIDHDQGPLDGDTRRRNIHEIAADLEGQLHARFNDHRHAALDVNRHAGVQGMVHAHFFVLVAANGQGLVGADLLIPV